MSSPKIKKVPRASFSITLLDDEDYRLLVSDKCGIASLGTFLAICLVGRRRLLDRHATRIDGTDSLRLDDSVQHVLALARLTERHFEMLLGSLARVAEQTRSKPWVYVDDDGRIVIRSFFKFNADANHGGPRPGTGPKPREDSRAIQESSSCIQDDSSSSSGGVSYSSSYSYSSSSLSLESERERETASPPKQTKPEAKTAPTVVDDDDPVPVDLDGPIGGNTAKQVRETIWTADQLWPAMDNTVRIVARQWLADHPAKRIIAAMNTAKANGIGKPEPYIRSLLADPTFPREATGRRTAPQRPAAPELKPWVPPVLPDSMFDLTPEEEAILARKGKTA